LTLKTEAFVGWEVLRGTIDIENQTVSQLERAKLSVVSAHTTRTATRVPDFPLGPEP
jgi:hypothetical protein